MNIRTGFHSIQQLKRCSLDWVEDRLTALLWATNLSSVEIKPPVVVTTYDLGHNTFDVSAGWVLKLQNMLKWSFTGKPQTATRPRCYNVWLRLTRHILRWRWCSDSVLRSGPSPTSVCSWCSKPPRWRSVAPPAPLPLKQTHDDTVCRFYNSFS